MSVQLAFAILRNFPLQYIDEFIKCHNDFCLNLADYLKKQEESFDIPSHLENITKAFQNAIFHFHAYLLPKPQKEISSFLSKNRQEVRIYNFISFNYTTLFDHCLFSTFPGNKIVPDRKEGANVFHDRIGSLIHIHGITTSKLIMGVNDEKQIDNYDFLSTRNLKRLFIKPVANELNHMGNDEVCNQLIDNCRIIIVYGMSLGVTDNIWWVRIKNWLNVGKDRYLILYMYKQSYNDIIQASFLQAEEEIENLFFTNAGVLPEEQDRLRNQIFVNFNTPLFSDTSNH